MLIRCIAAEWLKLRRTRIWLLLLSLPMISTGIGFANYSFNQGVLLNGWYSLWTQASFFYAQFFFPVLIAICCAFLCRLEHLNKNWHLALASPVTPASIFVSKLTVVGALLLLVQGCFFLMYVCAGKLAGLSGGFPPEVFGWLLRSWLSGLAIGALQLALSVVIRSFALPVGIGLCLSFVGLAAYVGHTGMLVPHSLLTIGMGALSQEALTPGKLVLHGAMTIGYILLFSSLAVRRLKRTDAAV